MSIHLSSLRFCARLAVMALFTTLCLSLPACSPPANNGGCKSDDDCKGDATKKICDKNAEKCVQCVRNDNCPEGEICKLDTFTCFKGCTNTAECTALFPDRKKTECRSNACVFACDSNEECLPDEVCTDSKCVKGERPKEEFPGKYQACPQGQCQANLECLSPKGSSTRLCWKKCSSGCDADEVCIPAERFADGHEVCMKKIEEESASYNYAEGTACAEGLVTLQMGSVSFGTCWKSCEDKCLGDRVCNTHPNLTDKAVKLCFKPCQADSECPKGSRCKENTDLPNKDFQCF